MKSIPIGLYCLSMAILFSSCSPPSQDYVISFASCNQQNMTNKLWEPILKHQPDIFIWGGDIVYSDTEDMKLMKQNYELMKADSGYSSFREKIEVMGTWDDHDYGLNDGGASYIKKDSVQQIFLDFFDVPSHDPRRARKGIYTSKTFDVNGSSIKIIILDTRYFRSDLTVDPSGQRRYIPVENPGDTMLGTAQWKWLEEELMTSSSQFNIIVSSIQFLSSEHGFETWGNMPLEVEKMKDIIVKSKAKGVIFLSGDRHLAEISKLEVEGLDYPLIDFTSSGMTHSYSTYSGEPNSLRISDVIADKNFGLLYVDVNNNTVTMEIRGEDDQLFQRIIQKY
jgi:alkaline phosphatase D